MPAARRAAPGRAGLEIVWSERAVEDRDYWHNQDRQIAARLDRLIADILEHRFTGIGKPEPLKHDWSGYWSRRITHEHRLIYRLDAGVLYIVQCRYHY